MNDFDKRFFDKKLNSLEFKTDCIINNKTLQGFFVEQELFEIRMILAEVRNYVKRRGNK